MLRFNFFRAAPLLRCNARCKCQYVPRTTCYIPLNFPFASLSATSTTAGGFPEKLAFAFDIVGILLKRPFGTMKLTWVLT
jgi:hypothetical protein